MGALRKEGPMLGNMMSGKLNKPQVVGKLWTFYKVGEWVTAEY